MFKKKIIKIKNNLVTNRCLKSQLQGNLLGLAQVKKAYKNLNHTKHTPLNKKAT